MPTLLRAPRWIKHRSSGYAPQRDDVLIFSKRTIYVVLDFVPLDPNRSKYRYDMRLLVGRVTRSDASRHLRENAGARRFRCKWDRR